jgi:hypothetical protein
MSIKPLVFEAQSADLGCFRASSEFFEGFIRFCGPRRPPKVLHPDHNEIDLAVSDPEDSGLWYEP